MTRSSSMTSLAPRLPVLSVGFGSVFCSMPLGRIAGPPVTPLSLTIPARKSATTCFRAAFSASRRSVRASRSPRDSSERGIFSGTDMLGTNRVRYEQGQPRSSSYLPGFLPQVRVCRLEALFAILFAVLVAVLVAIEARQFDFQAAGIDPKGAQPLPDPAGKVGAALADGCEQGRQRTGGPENRLETMGQVGQRLPCSGFA